MPPVSAESDDNDNSGDYPPLTDQGISFLSKPRGRELILDHQMLEYSTRSLPAQNNPQTLNHYHSVPFSQPTIVSLRRTAWTQTMTRSICASCSVSGIRGCLSNRYTKVSRRFWQNSGSRSKFIQAKTEISRSRRISALMKEPVIIQVCNLTRATRPAKTDDGLHSIRYMTRTPRISNHKPCALRHALPQPNILVEKMRATGIDRQGRAFGPPDACSVDPRAPNLPPQKLGGFG